MLIGILVIVTLLSFISTSYSFNLKMSTTVKNFIDGKFISVDNKSTVGNKIHIIISISISILISISISILIFNK